MEPAVLDADWSTARVQSGGETCASPLPGCWPKGWMFFPWQLILWCQFPLVFSFLCRPCSKVCSLHQCCRDQLQPVRIPAGSGIGPQKCVFWTSTLPLSHTHTCPSPVDAEAWKKRPTMIHQKSWLPSLRSKSNAAILKTKILVKSKDWLFDFVLC